MYAPEKYEENKTVARSGIEQAVPLLLAHMSPLDCRSLILDYGCGAGSTANKFLVPLAQVFDSKIHAVDISSSMVEFARTTFAHPNVEYYVGNLLEDDFPLRWYKYDKIFSMHVLHYIQDYKAAIRQFWNLLKPGGELCFSVVARGDAFDMYPMVGEHPKFKEYMKGYQEFVPSWFKKEGMAQHCKHCIDEVASDCGFKVLHSQIHFQRETVPVNKHVELYLALNPFIQKIPTDLMEDLRQLYREFTTKLNCAPIDADYHEVSLEVVTYVLRKPKLQQV